MHASGVQTARRRRVPLGWPGGTGWDTTDGKSVPWEGVVFQYWIERSCRFSIVMLEEPTEPLPMHDPP